LATSLTKHRDEAATALSEAAARTNLLVLGVLGVAIAAGLGVAFVLSASIVNPVTAVTRAARRLAIGDVDQTIEVRSKDELGEMAKALSSMIDYQREMATVAGAIAAGDLTVSVAPKSDVDTLGAAFASMIARLRGLVAQIQVSADELAHSSGALGKASGETSDVVQQVTISVQSVAAGSTETSRAAQVSTAALDAMAQAIRGIADGAQAQARQVQSAASTAGDMADGVQRVADDARGVAEVGEQARVSAQHGSQAVRETVVGMGEIKEVVSTAAGKVEELGHLGEKIGAVVETIDDIAEQTNLLALNAAIEAARAGEHGKGFAVVADEVRKLAERSQRETKAISELIREVQHGTRDAVEAMEAGSVRVEAGTSKADQAGQALVEILGAVDATVERVTAIAQAAHEMAGSAREVVDTMETIGTVVEESSAAADEMAGRATEATASIESIAAALEESSAATEEVSASAEEMSAQVEGMSAQAQQLAATAEQLKALVTQFRLESAGGPAAGGDASDEHAHTPRRRSRRAA
jgi:methyl-accepting chemotaxis protein